MVVSGRKQSTLKEIITDIKNSICIETLHSVCTTGAKKDNAQKGHQISYCPEKRIKPEAVEVAGQENQVRWRAEQSPQLPSRNTDIRDLEIPLPKTLNSLQPPKQEILNTYLGCLRLKKSLNERNAALLATLPAETTLLFSRKGERDLERFALSWRPSSWLPAGWEGTRSPSCPGPSTDGLYNYRRSMPRLTEWSSKNNMDLSREREIEMKWKFLSLTPLWFSVVWIKATFCNCPSPSSFTGLGNVCAIWEWNCEPALEVWKLRELSQSPLKMICLCCHAFIISVSSG